MLSQGIQFSNSVVVMSHMLQTLVFLLSQVMRDTIVCIFFIAQVRMSSHIMDWKLNHMDQIHYLIFQAGNCPTINHKRQLKDTV